MNPLATDDVFAALSDRLRSPGPGGRVSFSQLLDSELVPASFAGLLDEQILGPVVAASFLPVVDADAWAHAAPDGVDPIAIPSHAVYVVGRPWNDSVLIVPDQLDETVRVLLTTDLGRGQDTVGIEVDATFRAKALVVYASLVCKKDDNGDCVNGDNSCQCGWQPVLSPGGGDRRICDCPVE